MNININCNIVAYSAIPLFLCLLTGCSIQKYDNKEGGRIKMDLIDREHINENSSNKEDNSIEVGEREQPNIYHNRENEKKQENESSQLFFCKKHNETSCLKKLESLPNRIKRVSVCTSFPHETKFALKIRFHGKSKKKGFIQLKDASITDISTRKCYWFNTPKLFIGGLHKIETFLFKNGSLINRETLQKTSS